MEREVDLEGGNRRERMRKAKKRLKRFLSDEEEPPIPEMRVPAHRVEALDVLASILSN